MISRQACFAAFLAAFSIPAMAAEGIVVGHKDVVEADPALEAFARDVARQWMSAGGYDFAEIDKLFAPDVKTFMRNETPFEPFEAREDITSDYILNAVYTLQARKGSVPAEELSDYRGDAITDIATPIAQNYPWGTLPDVPGMVCRGAAFDVDGPAVRKFSRMHGVRLDRLVFFEKPVTLYAEPGRESAVVGVIPPFTLMAFDKRNQLGDTWHPMIASNGLKGYMGDYMQERTLAQKHVCFGKVDGKYKITALFGYGF